MTFLSDQFADHCAVLTLRPIFYGQHFFEFVVHHFSDLPCNLQTFCERRSWVFGLVLQFGRGDQLRCGITTDAVQAGQERPHCHCSPLRYAQAGALVAGHNLRGWCCSVCSPCVGNFAEFERC